MKSWLCGTSSVRRVPCWKRMFWQLKWSVNIQKYTSLDLLLTIYRKYMRIASAANNTGDNHNNIPTGLWVFVLWSAASWHHILLSTHSLTSPLLWPRVSRPDTPPPPTQTHWAWANTPGHSWHRVADQRRLKGGRARRGGMIKKGSKGWKREEKKKIGGKVKTERKGEKRRMDGE